MKNAKEVRSMAKMLKNTSGDISKKHHMMTKLWRKIGYEIDKTLLNNYSMPLTDLSNVLDCWR